MYTCAQAYINMLTRTYTFYLHLVLSCHKARKGFLHQTQGRGGNFCCPHSFVATSRETNCFCTGNTWIPHLDPVDTFGEKNSLARVQRLNTMRCADEERLLVDRRNYCCSWTRVFISSCLFKAMGCLSTSDQNNNDSSLLMHSLAYLETANTPPFMDPKQERATSQGTAREKLPRSLSAKVWRKTGWSALSHREENEVI